MSFNVTPIPIDSITKIGQAFTTVQENANAQIENIELVGKKLRFTTLDTQVLEIDLTPVIPNELDFLNGLTLITNTVKLGGLITENTTFTNDDSFNINFNYANSGNFKVTVLNPLLNNSNVFFGIEDNSFRVHNEQDSSSTDFYLDLETFTATVIDALSGSSNYLQQFYNYTRDYISNNTTSAICDFYRSPEYTNIELFDVTTSRRLQIEATLDSETLKLKSDNATNNTSVTLTPSTVEILANDVRVQSLNPTFQGVLYDTDYSANYVNRSLVDKGYVDNNFQPLTTRSHGAFSWTGSTSNQTITTSTVFEKSNQTTQVMGNLSDFEHTNGRLTYKNPVSKQFKIQSSCVVTTASTGQIVYVRIAVNGVTYATSENVCVVSGGNRWESVSPQLVITLNQNNYVELWLSHNLNGIVVSQRTMNVIVEELI
jgi:hypothetical protein